MSDINTGGLAFPFQCQGPTTAPEIYYGMTLRDYFAAKALQGLLSDSRRVELPIYFPSMAYALADEMLKARNA